LHISSSVWVGFVSGMAIGRSVQGEAFDLN